MTDKSTAQGLFDDDNIKKATDFIVNIFNPDPGATSYSINKLLRQHASSSTFTTPGGAPTSTSSPVVATNTGFDPRITPAQEKKDEAEPTVESLRDVIYTQRDIIAQLNDLIDRLLETK